MNAIEQPPHASVAERLALCLPHLAIDWRSDAPLRELALDSMDTVELLCVVHEEFGVRLSEDELGPGQTLRGLLAIVAQGGREAAPRVPTTRWAEAEGRPVNAIASEAACAPPATLVRPECLGTRGAASLPRVQTHLARTSAQS